MIMCQQGFHSQLVARPIGLSMLLSLMFVSIIHSYVEILCIILFHILVFAIQLYNDP